MSTSVDVLTGLGEGPFVYREVKSKMGILTGPFCKPRMLTPKMTGYYLGLHDEAWAETRVRNDGTATYFLVAVPIYNGFSDPNGDPLVGTPNTKSFLKGTLFDWDPFPIEYPCTGYQVWAGNVAGTYYLQGTLTGRYSCVWEVGVTGSYVSSGSTLSAQTIGPPAFADSLEVYQLEGATDMRVFLGGGKKYSTGYATVADATAAAVMTGGTDALTTVATWEAITDGSFRMRIGWAEAASILYGWENGADREEWFDFTGVDFSGDASMADVAATLQAAIRAPQAPALFGGTDVEQTMAVWNAITDGSFDLYVDGTVVHVTALDFSGDAAMTNVAATIQARIRVATGNAYETCTWDDTAGRLIIKCHQTPSITDLVTNGTFATDSDWTKGAGWTISAGAAHANIGGAATSLQQTIAGGLGKRCRCLFTVSNRSAGGANVFYGSGTPFKGFSADGSYDTEFLAGASGDLIFNATASAVFDLDDVILYTKSIIPMLSHAERHSGGTGTDVSGLLDMEETSPTAVLNRRGKEATTETVAWSTDHFVITNASSGDQYSLSYLQQATGNVGTDISSATHMDCRSDSATASYTPGKTAKRTVIGEGVVWGEWAAGMDFRAEADGEHFLVNRYRGPNQLLLDSDYDGDCFNGNVKYVLRPYSEQLYTSALGNPFKFAATDIVKLPTNDSDGITAIVQSGALVALIMDHHVWMVDGVDVTAPRMISATEGAPNTSTCIPYENGAAIFTGEDFVFLLGGRLRPLDPENRVKSLLSRLSAKVGDWHGILLKTEDTDLLIWYVSLDSASVYNTAIVYEPKTGNWWLYNSKNSRCSCVIRDVNNRPYLLTGQDWDEDNSIPAFTFLHGTDYKNDGGNQSTGTLQGTIDTVGSATTTAGNLTCAASGALATFQAVTRGFFSLTVDGNDYDVGPCDFSGDSSLAEVAATIQTALRGQTSGSETVTYSTDHFVITSGTATNQSRVSYLRPYYPLTTDIDISAQAYMNGRDGLATKTAPVDEQILTLDDMDGTVASLYTTNDGEKGIYLYVCDTDMKNGQYARIKSNDATTVTICPSFSTQPVAGWYWFIGGIVPTWTKWFDWGSPQHKQKLHGISITSDPDDVDDDNRLSVQGMQELSDTIRTNKTIALDSDSDAVNTIHLADKPATQHGLKLLRPSSEKGLTIDDITIVHAHRV